VEEVNKGAYVLHSSVELAEPLDQLLTSRTDLRFSAINGQIPYPWTRGCTWLYASLMPYPDRQLGTQLWWLGVIGVGTGVVTTYPVPAPAESVPAMLQKMGVSSATFRIDDCEPTGYNPYDPTVEIRTAQREVNRLVYFIQPAGGGLIKIGVAARPKQRLYHLQTGSPVELRLVGTLPGGQPLEAELHQRFAEHRVRGEWFEPTAELLSLIAGGLA
jgi:hypothetical protein